ncbi:MAG: vanadium-dependent haloperoxidase [Limisphaerales bacterium]
MKLKLIRMLMLLAALPLARADAVLDWNAIAATTILAGGRPGPSAILDFAVVHAGIHDAVQAYDQTFQPYATIITGAVGSPAAAVAKATRDVLVNRFPAQAAAVETAYVNYLTANAIALNDAGLAVGAQVAAGIIAARTGDGAFPTTPPPPFTGSTGIGMWRPTPTLLPGGPPTLSPMAATWIADTTPFVVLSGEQFAPNAPYATKTGLYTKEYNETKALGALNSTARTPEQTQLGYFYADNFIAIVHRMLRGLAQNDLDNSADRARMLALSWITAADGLIAAWTSKLQYPTWRPITAIREGNNDGNAKTVGDPDWQPLVNTPNYPDQASGANTLMGGVTQVLKMFFGTDKMTFTVTSAHPNANPTQRTYSRFSDVSLDVVEVRIYQGIHFRTADLDGRRCGRNVARYVFENSLLPLNGNLSVDEEND